MIRSAAKRTFSVELDHAEFISVHVGHSYPGAVVQVLLGAVVSGELKPNIYFTFRKTFGSLYFNFLFFSPKSIELFAKVVEYIS
jgi:hypothetical protein